MGTQCVASSALSDRSTVAPSSAPTALSTPEVSERMPVNGLSRSLDANVVELAYAPWMNRSDEPWLLAPTSMAGLPSMNQFGLQAAPIDPDYDERLQEEVYLKRSRTPSPVNCYDEGLQERLYWAEAMRLEPSTTSAIFGQQSSPDCFIVGPATSTMTAIFGQQPSPDCTRVGAARFRTPPRRSAAAWGGEGPRGGMEDAAASRRSFKDRPDLDARAVPVKHTFIHFDSDDSQSFVSSTTGRSSRSTSAPPSNYGKVSSPAPLADAQSNDAHVRGDCRPCAYFWYKEDGCRNADSCKFCHDCPRGEIQRKKKEKKAKRRAIKAMMHADADDL